LESARRKEELGLAALISACCFLIHGAVDVSLSVPGITLTVYALVGLVGSQPTPLRRPRISSVVLAAFVLLASLYLAGPRALAEWHRARAEAYVRAGMLQEARREILSAMDKEPDNPDRWSELADLEQKIGGDKTSLPSFRRAAVLGGDVPSHHLKLAMSLWRLSRNEGSADMAEEAREELKKALAGSPHDPDLRLLLAFWLESDGRPDEALIEYGKGLKLIKAALAEPDRIRRHTPAEHEILARMVSERIDELQKRVGESGGEEE